MGRNDTDQRYWPEQRGDEQAVVADSQAGTVAIFTSMDSARLAADRLERGAVTLDTFHWHRDPMQAAR